MAMSKPSKHRKTGIYWFRRRVPADCQSVIGKREWSKTLETTDLRVAQRAILKYIVETDEQIQAIRGGTCRRYSDDDLEQIAMGWGMDFSMQLSAHESLPPSTQDFTDEVYRPISSEAELDESIQRYLNRMDWSELGTMIETGSPDYDVLRKHCFDEHLAGHVWGRPKPLERLATDPVKVKSGDGPTLLQTFESYISEAQPRTKTADEFRKSILDFLALHGGDIPIREVTKAMIVEYKDLLLKKPRKLSWKQRELNLRDLVKQVKSDDTISAATVKKALSPINAAFEYAITNDLVQVNPARGVKVTGPKNSGPKRLPYSIEDMNRIFASPIWSKSKLQERYWLPLLALWTGARVEELAQLYVSDIQNQDGIDFINIAEIEEGQKLKNLSSIRRVPIHPELVRLGFLNYVKKRSNAKMLFDIKPYRKSETEIKYAHYFSKWWGGLCRDKLGITNPKLVFHSFRHSFKDAGREAGLDKAVVDALQGHSDGSVSGQYGSGYPLAALSRAMKKIRFSGLKV